MEEPQSVAARLHENVKKSPFAFSAGIEGKAYYEVLDMSPKQRGLWNVVLQNLNEFRTLSIFPFQNLVEQAKKSPERPCI